jgi:hypothetical protein
MNTDRIILLAAVLALAGSVCLAQATVEWKDKVDNYNWLLRTLESDARDWSETQRTQIVARCNSILGYSTPPGRKDPDLRAYSCEEALAVLIRAGDTNATQFVLREYARDQKSARRLDMIFIKARAPHTIPLLAELLYLNPEEDKPVRVQDVIYAPRAFTSARTIVQILRFSPQFPESVRRGATVRYRAAGPGERVTVDMMKKWWEENKDSILAGILDSVSVPGEKRAANKMPRHIP